MFKLRPKVHASRSYIRFSELPDTNVGETEMQEIPPFQNTGRRTDTPCVSSIASSRYRFPIDRMVQAGMVVLALLAIYLRVAFYPFHSHDFDVDLTGWYGVLREQGFRSFGTYPYYYSHPYLMLLYLGTLVGLSPLLAVKSLAVLFDLLLAYGIMRIVRLETTQPHRPMLAGIMTLFVPSVFFNGSMWGQCDAAYTAFLLFSFTAVHQGRYARSWAFWAVAFALKLQAAFFVPFLVFLWVSDARCRFFAPLAAVGTYALLLVPSLLAGRPLADLLMIYFTQAHGYPQQLTWSSPNLYQWVPNFLSPYFVSGGLCLATACVGFCALNALMQERGMRRGDRLTFATFLLFLVPFLLPRMHERYMMSAEIFLFALAFARPRFTALAVLSQIVVFFSYTPYLADGEPPAVPTLLQPFFILIILAILAHQIYWAEPQEEVGDGA